MQFTLSQLILKSSWSETIWEAPWLHHLLGLVCLDLRI